MVTKRSYVYCDYRYINDISNVCTRIIFRRIYIDSVKIEFKYKTNQIVEKRDDTEEE